MYIVKYSGSFGFMKPWSAVRDSKTKSNDFLTPSVLMGIERKLFDELDVNDLKIKRHRLQFSGVSFQQEQTTSINYEIKKPKKSKVKTIRKSQSIVSRGVLVNPILYLCFEEKEFAEEALTQHIVLGRNEDILLPECLLEIELDDFNSDTTYSGFESFISNGDEINSIYCGMNKYTNQPQYCVRKIFGTPKNLI
ncbi:MAG: hypothetical protein ACOC2U_03050 [bacterium]